MAPCCAWRSWETNVMLPSDTSAGSATGCWGILSRITGRIRFGICLQLSAVLTFILLQKPLILLLLCCGVVVQSARCFLDCLILLSSFDSIGGYMQCNYSNTCKENLRKQWNCCQSRWTSSLLCTTSSIASWPMNWGCIVFFVASY